MLDKISSYLNIIRWKNCSLAWFAVWVGAYTSGIHIFNLQLIYAFLAATFIAAAGNVSNDIADYNVDKEFKPARPLSSGIITRLEAWFLCVIFFLSGIISAFKISRIHGISAFIIVLALLLYNFLLKKTPLLGNLIVAFISAFPFIFGGLLSLSWKWSLIPFVFAVLVHFAREILKSIEDVYGDTSYNIRTIAAYLPCNVLKKIVVGIFLFVVVISIVPYLLYWYGNIYLIILVVGVYLPKFLVIKLLTEKKWLNNFPRIHQMLKIEMLAGSIAVLFAR